MIADGNCLPVTVRRRAVITGGVSAVLLLVVYLLAVWTPVGQHFEDAVLRAAERAADGPDGMRAIRLLDKVSAPALGVALVVVLAIGWLRRRPLLGLLGAGVIVASVLTVELLQRSVLRPILLETGRRREDQSFPSGHTAIAMAVMCALVLVVPYRYRSGALLLASVGAASVGVATVTAGWHRPSDTLGSDLVVVVYTCVAVAVLAWLGRVSPVAPAGGPRTWMYPGVLAFASGMAVVVGIGSAAIRASLVLGSGRAVALAGSVAVALTLLGLLHRVELSAPLPTSTPVDDREL